MVRSTQTPASSDRIAVSKPHDDARHNANFIKTASISIKDNMTDFIVQPFTDRIFVIVTQLQKMGTMVRRIYFKLFQSHHIILTLPLDVAYSSRQSWRCRWADRNLSMCKP